VTPADRACLALDLGGATTSAALLGRIAGRWRLVGQLSMPATIPVDAVVETLAGRLAAAEPRLAAALEVDRALVDWPRLVARTVRPPRLVILAATDRTLGRLVSVARRAGWSVRGASAEGTDPLEMTRLVLHRETSAVLVGANDPPAPDERSVLADLAALVAAAATRRSELTVVLSGALSDHADRFEDAEIESVATAAEALRDSSSRASAPAGSPAGPWSAPDGHPTLLLAPAPTAGDPAGEALRLLLDELRSTADDGRRAMVRTTASLARHLDRRVETIEIGYDGGLRASARPARGGSPTHVRWATSADAAIVPDPVDDEVVDGVLGWSTLPLDRYRMRDRLAELRISPWSEAHGDGAQLRLAAARAALARLAARTPDLDRPVPDLVVIAGGAWSVAPGAAVGLAVADVLRRPGACQMALDRARLLGPVGTIADDQLRDEVVADLVDDLLVPLGSVVIPSGLRAGRTAGHLVVHAEAGTTELELVPGGLELVDLPPGESAIAEFRFRDTVVLGTRGKRFAIDVSGGLGGLLVDLRDVPLHLPDRADRRRELLGAWQRALWIGMG
jgi:hypothetical protein